MDCSSRSSEPNVENRLLPTVRCFAQVDPFALNFSEPPAFDAMYGVDGAARRRDRRLRQFTRHEQLSVKMHVAAALHHSAQRGAREDAATQTMNSTNAATSAATATPAPVIEYVALVLAVYATPATFIAFATPAPLTPM